MDFRKRRNQDEIEKCLSELKGIPGVEDLLNISGMKRDIINGKIQDNALSRLYDGEFIEIRYNPNNKTSRYLRINRLSGSHIACFLGEIWDNNKYCGREWNRIYDAKSMVEVSRGYHSNDGKSSENIGVNRDPNHIERVEYWYNNSDGKNFSTNLDISVSSSDISTLDACNASDLKLMEMSQVEPDFERVKQKILESRKKQEVCSYIADRNHLERASRESGKKDLNLGGKWMSAGEILKKLNADIGVDDTQLSVEEILDLERSRRQSAKLRDEWNMKWIDGYNTPGERALLNGIRSVEGILHTIYGENFPEGIEGDDVYQQCQNTKKFLEAKYEASKARRREQQIVEDEGIGDRKPDPLGNPTEKTLEEIALEMVQRLERDIKDKSALDEERRSGVGDNGER